MIKLENISKYYYSSSMVTCALRKINLEFNIGEFVAITGESGSGKTTLLNVISGLDTYEDGEMYFNGKMTSYFDDDDWEKYRKEEVAFVFQNYNLIDSFTVLENVITAFVIDGYSYKESKTKAKDILKLVGLENDTHKKASKLSGGQKQRLAIARALAKETNIIVADEPTANLDVENGNMVLELLKKISHNKLVIVVSHNQGQIEPFITRKIRLHDGELISDEKIVETPVIKPAEKEKTEIKAVRQVLNFSRLNLKSQPKRSFLMFMLVLVATLASFVFLANFKANIDDHKTKALSTNLFYNLDDTRMLVRKNDGAVITDDILNEAYVKDVKYVEKYDLITDMNYFRPTDYKMKYSGGIQQGGENDGQLIDNSSYLLKDYSHYMRSGCNLKESDLSAGRLPVGNFEMVVYSEDESVLGTEELVFFQNTRKWGVNFYYRYNMKIVGILKEKTDQAYFSEDICMMMDLSEYDVSMEFYYFVREYGRTKQRALGFNNIAIDPNIGEYDISFDDGDLSVVNGAYSVNANNLSYTINNKTTTITAKYNIIQYHTICEDVLGVSKEFFIEIYNHFKEKTQFAIFVSDYAYLDEVSSRLLDKEFDSLSCFKASVTGYNKDKVVMRYVNLGVSIFALILLNVLVIVIGFAIMKVKKNDYIIFKMIGMSNSLSRKINYIELLVYSLISSVIMITASIIVKYTVNEPLIVEMYKYVKFYDYLIIYFVVTLSMLILGRMFNKYLAKCAKVTVLKEE